MIAMFPFLRRTLIVTLLLKVSMLSHIWILEYLRQVEICSIEILFSNAIRFLVYFNKQRGLALFRMTPEHLPSVDFWCLANCKKVSVSRILYGCTAYLDQPSIMK